MGNAYTRVRRLSSRPAFSFRGTDARPLRCPFCGELFGRIPEYDGHFMDHGPTREQGSRWLSWRSFERRFPEAARAGEDARDG